MILSKQEVKHISNLARLELSEDEVEKYREQLSNILEYFSMLQSLDTKGVAPTDGSEMAVIRLRSDIPRPGLTQEKLFENAPEIEAGQFLIPPVLD